MSVSINTTKREETYQSLRTAILDGRFQPGEPISERIVARDLRVSRVPIREALIKLERDGLVVFVSRKGAFVRAFTADDLRQLAEARQALECTATRLAAGRMEVQRLEEFRREFQAFLEDPIKATPEKVQRVTTALHDAILSQCGNLLIQEMLTGIRGQVQLSRELSYDHASQTWVLDGVQQHLEILEALAQGDGPRAEGLMRAHIQAWHEYRIQTGKFAGSP